MISFRAEGQERATRLRASTLGSGYAPEDIRAVIAGERSMLELADEATPPPCINLIIDIQDGVQNGKGPGFERWAKVYNLKQMAAALQFLQEHMQEPFIQKNIVLLQSIPGIGSHSSIALLAEIGDFA